MNMATSSTPQTTDFTLDVLGRYICNGFDEAKQSADRSLRADAKPFDMIVIGGGTFGAVLASHLFQRDKTRQHRILVLEAGPLTLPEHQQNLPMINPGEVWGVPWNSDSPQTWNQQFPGLAFTLGGRSLYWGGWSPYFIDSELPTPIWPQSVKDELTQGLPQNGNVAYLDQSAQQIGTTATNDFINGVLHEQLRGRIFQGLQARAAGQPTVLTGNRGTLNAAPDLEAPLAVESTESRPGLFPFNKFSATPILARTSRLASEESLGDDVRKRFMVVANTHVIRLEMVGKRVTRIVTNQGTLDVPDTGQVFLGLGTIENTRLALNTLPNANGLIGRNLMAHLRSNLTIRVPRASFGAALDPNLHPELKELAVSALFVKGIHQHNDNSLGHFHVQVTASAVGDLETNSEAELFKKIPDIDGLDQFKGLTDQWVVITLRGIGEMIGDKTSPDPVNRVALDRLGTQGPFDYGQPRAKIRLEVPVGSKDMNLWDAMDQACDELALLFAAGNPNDIQYLSSQRNGVWQRNPPNANNRRDTLSSTHHEGGTLWMGAPGNSVTDEWGRFHESDNLYAVGPALLPTLGSPNPMLSGVALARRTADHLIPPPLVPSPETGFKYLFDGTAKSFKGWLTAGKGQFSLIDGNIVAYPGSDLGLLWYALENFGDFTLRLQFKLAHPTGAGNDNSGIFVRFRDPRRRVPDRNDPNVSYIYDNTAFVAVDTGFEIQLDEEARGNPNLGTPDGRDEHRTGAVYAIPIGAGSGQQKYQRGTAVAANQWYEFEIKVVGDAYTIKLKDTLGAAIQQTSTFTNTDSFRGKPITADPNSGYIGLQSHTGLVSFRNIRIKPM
jgi:hypothetical protein